MAFVLGIITARGGSKGIPGKNIRPCGGKPLIAWTIEAAQKSKSLDDLILSTDSREIADVAADFGLQTPELRPDHLAEDKSSSLSVIKYEIEAYEKRTGAEIDLVVLLQPTSPLRTSLDIDEACRQLNVSGANSLVSVCEDHHVHPSKIYRQTPDGITPLSGSYDTVPRQKMEKILTRNGALFLFKRQLPMIKNCLIDETVNLYVMSRESSIDIDDMLDLKLADFLLKDK